MTARVAKLVLILLVLGVTGCDQASKRWAEDDLPGHPRTLVAGRLDLAYAQNHGTAFSVVENVPVPAVLVAGLAMVGALGVALWRRRHEVSPLTAGYALVIAGALGNLIDRVTHGYVVDFVHLHGWPVFNVADCAIAVGAVLLFLGSARRRSAT
jgi:signal peptidase II